MAASFYRSTRVRDSYWRETRADRSSSFPERDDKLVPIVRILKLPHSRSAISINAVEVTPHGTAGQTHIHVVVNLFANFVSLSPGTTGLQSCVRYMVSLDQFWTHISVHGSALNSKVFANLAKLMGMRHRHSP